MPPRPIQKQDWHEKSGRHESKLAYCGNVLLENRNGRVVVLCNGSAEPTLLTRPTISCPGSKVNRRHYLLPFMTHWMEIGVRARSRVSSRFVRELCS
jgi:hypothetical protein